MSCGEQELGLGNITFSSPSERLMYQFTKMDNEVSVTSFYQSTSFKVAERALLSEEQRIEGNS